MIRTCLFSTVAVVALVVLLPQTTAATSFSVSPTQVKAQLRTGAPATEVLEVLNTSREPTRFKVYLEDWTQTETGVDSSLEPNTLPGSCASWITLDPVEFEIPPGQSQNVRATIAAPPEAAGGHWCMLYVENAPIPSKWSGSVTTNGRIGIRIYADVAGTETRECDFVALDFAMHSPLKITAVLRNTGNVPIRPAGEARIVDGSGQVMWQDQLKCFVLPERQRRIEIQPKVQLKAGPYRVIVTLDYDGREILQAERKLSVD